MTDADIEPFHTVRSQLIPHLVMTVAGFRQIVESQPARAKTRYLIAELDGELAGGAMASLHVHSARRDLGFINLVVAPALQGRGVGSALLGEVLGHLIEIGVTEVSGHCLDTPAGLRFIERHGFVQGKGMRASGVQLSELPPQPATPEGVRLVSAAEAGPAVVYGLDNVASRDIPGDVTFDDFPKDEWRQRLWDGVDARPDLGVVAYVDGVPAASTTVMADPATGRSWTSMTGVLAEYRGRGLARLVKSDSLRRCAAVGITHAYTANHSVNAPMLAVNKWLGYRPVAILWSCTKQI